MIGSIGELLVEFVCSEKDGRNLRAAPYVGPFPSGAPGIFIDQAARIAGGLGGRAVFAGAVGDDAFGTVILNRLTEDGVDPGLIRVIKGVPTGSAHVSYNSDGSRDFVFNIAHSAAARLPGVGRDRSRVSGGGHHGAAHLGLDAGRPGDAGAGIGAVRKPCRARRGDFDRSQHPARVDCRCGLSGKRAPDHGDGQPMCCRRTPMPICCFRASHLTHGPRASCPARPRSVVLKRGDQGCIGRDATATHSLPALATDVVDPTGAGDCFCATFVTLLAAGQPLPTALARANAAGALAVAQLGPMEGNAGLAEIDARIAGLKG